MADAKRKISTAGRSVDISKLKSRLMQVGRVAIPELGEQFIQYDSVQLAQITLALDALASAQDVHFFIDIAFGPEREMLLRAVVEHGDKYTLAWYRHEDGLFLEQGGDIYPVEGGYTYNDLQVGGSGHVDVRVRKDAVAWFHTHPPGGAGGRHIDRSNRYWSRGDRAQNRNLSRALGRSMTAFVGGTDGAVRSFTNGGPRKGIEVRAPGFIEWKK